MHFDLPHLGQRDHHPPANVIDMLQLIAIEEHPDVSGIVAAPDRSGDLPGNVRLRHALRPLGRRDRYPPGLRVPLHLKAISGQVAHRNNGGPADVVGGNGGPVYIGNDVGGIDAAQPGPHRDLLFRILRKGGGCQEAGQEQHSTQKSKFLFHRRLLSKISDRPNSFLYSNTIHHTKMQRFC